MPASWSWPTRRSSGPAPATPRPARRRSGRPMSGSCAGPMRSAGSRCGPMPTPRASRPTPSSVAPRGSGCAAPSTCSLGEERVAAVRTMIFASSAAEEQAAYDTLLPLQRDDFVGIFAGHGRQAGHGAAARPAAARVPARPGRAGRGRRPGHPAGRDDGGGRRRRGPAPGPGRRDAGQGQRPARDQPDAGAARGAPGDRQAGAVRHAGPGHLSRPRPRSRPTAATRSWRS